MANLAIGGHSTRGREVIAWLEMLGGENKFQREGDNERRFYYIDKNERIQITSGSLGYILFDLEEFEKLYPYKVGDKVTNEYKLPMIIFDVYWDSDFNVIKYNVRFLDDDKTVRTGLMAEELQPYEEETMEENLTIQDIKDNNAEWLLNKLQEMSYGKAMQTINDLYDELHKSQYPKDYEECCSILSLPHSGLTIDVPLHYSTTLIYLTELLICRDAYWKIAGEQMGLDKPWEPEWVKNANTKMYIVYNTGVEVTKLDGTLFKNYVLVFPTVEMRDAFYENFKDLINECKELL